MPSSHHFTPIQVRILRALAHLDPPPTLTGAAPLAGLYLGHRQTRDLDLAWHDREDLGTLPADAEAALRKAGLEVNVLQTERTFSQLRAAELADTSVVDLIVELAPALYPAERVAIADFEFLVESRAEVLASKMCALLSRSELRDLRDVKALVDVGEDLDRALATAPRKDAGFSPPLLAHLLDTEFDIASMAAAEGSITEKEVRELEVFRQELVRKLMADEQPARDGA